MTERAAWVEEQVAQVDEEWRGVVRNMLRDAMTVADANPLEGGWTKATPLSPGWYWFRNMKRKDYQEPQIIQLRDYAGALAVGNSTLEGFTLFEEGEWIGPITPATPPRAEGGVREAAIAEKERAEKLGVDTASSTWLKSERSLIFTGAQVNALALAHAPSGPVEEALEEATALVKEWFGRQISSFRTFADDVKLSERTRQFIDKQAHAPSSAGRSGEVVYDEQMICEGDSQDQSGEYNTTFTKGADYFHTEELHHMFKAGDQVRVVVSRAGEEQP